MTNITNASDIKNLPMTIHSPNGEIHICSEIDEESGKLICNYATNNVNNVNNARNANNTNNEETQMILIHCGIVYDLTPLEYANKEKLHYYTLIVHTICLIEVFTYLLLTITTNIHPYELLGIIITLIGLDATITYNKCTMFIYLFNQYIQTICKLLVLFSLFVPMSIKPPPIYLRESGSLVIKNQVHLILFFIFIYFYQLFLTYNVHRLYKLLPRHRRQISY